MSPRTLTLALALALAGACAPEPAAPASAPSAPAAAHPVGKPAAPVELVTSTRALGGGAHEVIVTARATRAVPALELAIDGTREAFGPQPAGATVRLAARVTVDDGRGVDVVASAATGVARHRRTAAAVVRVGAPAAVAAPPPTRTLTLPDGTEVLEVRP